MRKLVPFVLPVLAVPLVGAELVPLRDAVSLEPQALGSGASVTLPLPPFPSRAGQVLVLSFRAFVRTPGPGGCNWNATVAVNDTDLGRFTAAGSERLLGRAPLLELLPEKLTFAVVSGNRLMILYAKDADQADSMTRDGRGGTFALDISDVARGVDGNSLGFTNWFTGAKPDGTGALVIQDLRVGYAERAALPRAAGEAPRRGPIAASVAAEGLTLAQGRGGGFAVTAPGVPDLLVETAFGMSAETPSCLRAEDAPPPGAGAPAPEAAPGPTLRAEPAGPRGFRLEAVWPQVRLARTLELRQGLVWWTETWTNTGAETLGIPFRHRVFLREGGGRFHIAGSPDNVFLASSAANPTLFVEPSHDPAGAGYGIAAESDTWRLLHSLRATGLVGEIYTACLALAPGKSLELTMTIAPVPSGGGGYWGFINALRKRWGVPALTMERPMFWGYARKPGIADRVEQLRASLGHLGPVLVVLGPWQRLEPDARVVRAGRYPRLPPDAPRAPGKCPDFDVEAFLTFRHREPYWAGLMAETRALREAIPGIQVIQMTHPAMECVYIPLEARWPMAADAVKTARGETFHAEVYDRAWVGEEMMARDWGVLYYVPRPGSAQMQAYLAAAERAMDEGGLDGIYSDEFSWAFTGRAYSRYDYSRWDGFSADLDETGRVAALKADGGIVTEACQTAMIEACRSRGRFFLANGGACLRAVQSLPHHRFTEGGNGPSWAGQGHLSPVPLILGNMGDQTSLAGVFASVRQCLAAGSIYSPVAVNLLLDGPENVVSKLYPITVLEIGPGWVVGRERIVTLVSRSFHWPEAPAAVRLYRYDAGGARLLPAEDRALAAGQPLALEVPDRGLVIAERR